MTKTLRHGYTTGACAAAGAKGAATMLLRQQLEDSVAITLPTGDTATFRLQGQKFDEHSASCFIVKDAGDDPDITNGAEIHVSVQMSAEQSGAGKCPVIISGGPGIGRVTKPGLAVPPGEWAINPVPRSMVTKAVRDVFPASCPFCTIHVAVSIPDGAERALKTLNARLGILGGLSILGTTGVVKPISAKAWTDTVDAAISVALACGGKTVIFSTGRTSEMTAQKFFEGRKEDFAEESYVMMGDHVGYALKSAADKGVVSVILACQFAKLLKIGCGHEQTHVSSSELDLSALAEWLGADSRTTHLKSLAQSANSARQVLQESGVNKDMILMVCRRAASFAARFAPEVDIKVLLAGYEGEVLYFC